MEQDFMNTSKMRKLYFLVSSKMDLIELKEKKILSNYPRFHNYNAIPEIQKRFF